MRNIATTAALLLTICLPPATKVLAQTAQYGTEVCVNASDLPEAKRRFPNARFHVLADFADPRMNGWRVVTGVVRPDGKIMTDAEEIKFRQREHHPGENKSMETELAYLFFLVALISLLLCLVSRKRSQAGRRPNDD